MSITPDTRSSGNRVAVFIDFDNVEIGVKSTIGGQFDIGLVLEAIKERGEIVTKIAYSDWKRAGDYSRILTQHAIRMVQRNLTPGGDKNGADITMALDALEMAFTHDHINTFVIVGGDSDFISLVEKLKQYGRKVIVVGGRQFTSVTMQKNCHEFIAYENLVGGSRGSRPAGARGKHVDGIVAVDQALPLVKRALKVLSEREVTPQLGLLKSTLLQLDSTFSERDYGASSFRDFMEKVAQAGAVTLRHAGRSMLVEAVEDGASSGLETPAERPHEEPAVEHGDHDRHHTRAVQPAAEEDEEAIPPSPMTMQDGIRALQQAFNRADHPPRWPMYVRQAKQFLRNTIEGFDERKYGFASVVDLLRAAGREGVLRLERDRQGAIRVFPGVNIQARPMTPSVEEAPGEAVMEVPDTLDGEAAPAFEGGAAEAVADAPIVDAEPVEPIDLQINGNVAQPGEQPRRSGARKRKTADVESKRKAPRRAAPARTPKARTPRSRAQKTSRGKAETADT
jgi:uncharacterized protein (TIGR00288 family)